MNHQEYMLHHLKNILAIDSPTGYTKHAVDYLVKEYEALGYQPQVTRKGGLFVCISEGDGSQPENALQMEAHLDTLAAWWRKSNRTAGCVLHRWAA